MEDPRSCFAITRLRGESRDDYLLVNIEPPLTGQPYGLGDRSIDLVIVATRHQGASLFPVSKWPVHVHVARLLVPYKGQETIGNDEMDFIAWAELYPTEEAARARGS